MQKNSVNKAILVGRLGQKPELKYTPAQVGVANITLATNESRKNAQGDWENTTEWHRVVVFGKTAEFVSTYLDKGALIYVEGRLQTRSWENKDGVKISSTEVVAMVVTPLGGKSEGTSTGGPSSTTPTSNYPPMGSGEDDEPLPF
jgi:single-strand DNA-binding protein